MKSGQKRWFSSKSFLRYTRLDPTGTLWDSIWTLIDEAWLPRAHNSAVAGHRCEALLRHHRLDDKWTITQPAQDSPEGFFTHALCSRPNSLLAQTRVSDESCALRQEFSCYVDERYPFARCYSLQRTELRLLTSRRSKSIQAL